MHKILITQGSCGTHAVEDCLKGEYNRDIPGFTHLVHEFGVLTINHPSAPQLQGWNTHTNNPTVAPKNSKVVYLLANPYDTVLSYFRRDAGQVLTRGPFAGRFLYHHTRHLGGDFKYFENNEIDTGHCNLETFLEDDYDPFFLKQHFSNWVDYDKRNYELMVMKYESLSENGIDPLTKYWQIIQNPRIPFNFIKRNSSWKDLEQKLIDGLERKYGEFFDLYDSLPLFKNIKQGELSES